jgi:hypothetical protein
MLAYQAVELADHLVVLASGQVGFNTHLQRHKA